ncbi:hypothetical protein SISNIDRAFT_488660 [Sistotremastrum niveocremeum HHB9708]|uniref:Uncharacterized protein n=1 Tax=Sistotremastrum niveocremeum HHB9708 TaxID=1314777 RepID=A0A164R035_9AGAM|nr:hypothetical protein SISNIDRAFT_488660 [Sistotremastrum niveocremeum HHB9708]
MSPVPSFRQIKDLKTVINELAHRDPSAIPPLNNFNQRLRLALTPHITESTDILGSSPLAESSTSVNSSPDDIRIIVEVLREVSLDTNGSPEQEDELKAAFEALRIAFGEQEDLPKDNAEFLEFAARKLEEIAAEKASQAVA